MLNAFLLFVVSSSNSTSMSGWQTFSTGALSKTLATVVTYPYIMAKVRLQARTADDLFDPELIVNTEEDQEKGFAAPGKNHSKRDHGALDILHVVWKKQGFQGWYRVCYYAFLHLVFGADFLVWC